MPRRLEPDDPLATPRQADTCGHARFNERSSSGRATARASRRPGERVHEEPQTSAIRSANMPLEPTRRPRDHARAPHGSAVTFGGPKADTSGPETIGEERMRSFGLLQCGALIGLAMSTTLSSQADPAASPTRLLSSHVYAWFPDDTVRRLSPGPASSPSAAMPAGPFTQASIHPAGTAVVFWGGLEARPRVWLYDFATSAARPLTAANVGSLEPSFDWQGRQIVFAADVAPASPDGLSAGPGSWRRSNMNIFIMDADGSKMRQLTEGAFQDSRPAFSPDGTKIVFLSNRGGGNRQLYVVPADRSALPRRLLPDSVIVRPWFSADGKFIYFTYANLQFKDEQIRIWRIPADGGGMEAVTPDGLPNSQGLFVDPDGLHLWFHSNGTPYRFELGTRTLTRTMPPGFAGVGHLTRSRNGVITFDSTQREPTARQ